MFKYDCYPLRYQLKYWTGLTLKSVLPASVSLTLSWITSRLTWPCHSSSQNSKYSRKRSIETRVMVFFLSPSKHSHLLPPMVHSGKEWCASICLTVHQIRLWRQNLPHFHHVPEIGRVISPLSCFLLLVCLLVRNSSFYPPFSSGSHNDWCQVHHNLERSSRLKRFRLTDYVFSNQRLCSFGFWVTNLYCSAISSSHKEIKTTNLI